MRRRQKQLSLCSLLLLPSLLPSVLSSIPVLPSIPDRTAPSIPCAAPSRLLLANQSPPVCPSVALACSLSRSRSLTTHSLTHSHSIHSLLARPPARPLAHSLALFGEQASALVAGVLCLHCFAFLCFLFLCFAACCLLLVAACCWLCLALPCRAEASPCG